MDTVEVASEALAEHFAVRGMTCGSCVRHVTAALTAVPGVQSAQVDLAAGTATVRCDPATASFQALQEAVAAAGYALDQTVEQPRTGPSWRPFAFGLLAALALLGFYLGVITLAQGWTHAVQQLGEDRWFIAAIATGFGTQLGLFTALRGLHAGRTATGVAASTGTSTAAMLACCAHHLVDIVPILGLSAATLFLSEYKTPLLWLGIGMNLAGIAYLLWQLRQQRTMACLSNGGLAILGAVLGGTLR
ncbi:MAG: heavy metal translocating P-type ATPase [Chloroflexi bacterium]|nr:heavy metal translocating P-type ATPase [Chloroflexota bacterium]